MRTQGSCGSLDKLFYRFVAEAEHGLGYWLLPDEACEEPEAAVPWARLALEAARRKPVKASCKKS